MKRTAVVIILTLVSALALIGGDDELIDRKFPDFTFKTLDKEELVLSEFCEENPTIVTFWATWCKPCVKELGKLKEMKPELDARGVKVIAICEDGPRTQAKIKPFVRKEGWDFIICLDSDGKLKSKVGVADIPEFFILKSDMQIAYHHVSFKPGDEVEYLEQIEKLFPVLEEEKEIEEQ